MTVHFDNMDIIIVSLIRYLHREFTRTEICHRPRRKRRRKKRKNATEWALALPHAKDNIICVQARVGLHRPKGRHWLPGRVSNRRGVPGAAEKYGGAHE